MQSLSKQGLELKSCIFEVQDELDSLLTELTKNMESKTSLFRYYKEIEKEVESLQDVLRKGNTFTRDQERMKSLFEKEADLQKKLESIALSLGEADRLVQFTQSQVDKQKGEIRGMKAILFDEVLAGKIMALEGPLMEAFAAFTVSERNRVGLHPAFRQLANRLTATFGKNVVSENAQEDLQKAVLRR